MSEAWCISHRKLCNPHRRLGKACEKNKNMLWLENDPLWLENDPFCWKRPILLENNPFLLEKDSFLNTREELLVGKRFSLVGKQFIRLEKNLSSGRGGGSDVEWHGGPFKKTVSCKSELPSKKSRQSSPSRGTKPFCVGLCETQPFIRAALSTFSRLSSSMALCILWQISMKSNCMRRRVRGLVFLLRGKWYASGSEYTKSGISPSVDSSLFFVEGIMSASISTRPTSCPHLGLASEAMMQ